MKSFLQKQLSAFRSGNRGAMLVFGALLLPVFIGFTALAIDVGLWYKSKRHLQLIADSTAVGAAYAIKNGTSVSTYGLHAAKLNQFEATGGNTITINNPPTTGPYANDDNAVEVILTAPASLYFSPYFISNTVFPLKARAVAFAKKSDKASCLTILDPSVSSALSISGGAIVNVQNCETYVNSNSSSALATSGNSVLSTGSLKIVGNYSQGGTSQIISLSPIQTGVVATGDPFASTITMPTFSGCNYNNKNVNTVTVLSPGVYCNGLKVSGVGIATLLPGVYVIDRGEFKVMNSGQVHGTGVTIFLTSSTGSNYANLNFTNSSVINLTAPTSGSLANVLMFSPQQAVDVEHRVASGSTVNLNGLLYFPNSNITFSGGVTTQSFCFLLAAKRANFQGGALFSNVCIGGIGSGSSTGVVEGISLAE
ncbi:MAG TPA: pilus assembly protein TadG-related protein [Candidatus Nitrosotenuis sp.]|nr:pilus assembly protein TadG-related protein [Candidatus Nitrosotenuis sp.]